MTRGGPTMPTFEANINYILTSPPSAMKQCNKSTSVKFHMELLLILRPGSSIAMVRHRKCRISQNPFPFYIVGFIYCKLYTFNMTFLLFLPLGFRTFESHVTFTWLYRGLVNLNLHYFQMISSFQVIEKKIGEQDLKSSQKKYC